MRFPNPGGGREVPDGSPDRESPTRPRGPRQFPARAENLSEKWQGANAEGGGKFFGKIGENFGGGVGEWWGCRGRVSVRRGAGWRAVVGTPGARRRSMARGTREEGELVRAFAREKGVSERTARNYRAQGRAEWREFLLGRGVAVPVAPVAAIAGGKTDLQKAREAADSAWQLLRQLQRDAASAEDAVTRAACARGVKEARRAWEDARRDAERLAEAAGEVVPVANVREAVRRGVAPLADLRRSFENNVAGELPPEWRPRFFAAAKKARVYWNNSIRALDEAMEGLVSNA